MLEINPSLYDDFIGKIIGYSFARFRELENPSARLYEFLRDVKENLRVELEPTLWTAGRPLSSADIYDFATLSIKSGQPTNTTSTLLDLLPQLKEKHEAFKKAKGQAKQTKNAQSQNLDLNTAKTSEVREVLMQKLTPLMQKGFIKSADNYEAYLSKDSINKMISNSAVNKSLKNGFTRAEHLSAVADIENLFAKAYLAKSEPHKSGEKNVIIHRFNSAFKDNNALITIKESVENGKRIYSVELELTPRFSDNATPLNSKSSEGSLNALQETRGGIKSESSIVKTDDSIIPQSTQIPQKLNADEIIDVEIIQSAPLQKQIAYKRYNARGNLIAKLQDQLSTLKPDSATFKAKEQKLLELKRKNEVEAEEFKLVNPTREELKPKERTQTSYNAQSQAKETLTKQDKEKLKESLEQLAPAQMPKILSVDEFLKALDNFQNKENFIKHLQSKNDDKSRLMYLNLVEPTFKNPDFKFDKIENKVAKEKRIKKFTDGKDFFYLLATKDNDKTLLTGFKTNKINTILKEFEGLDTDIIQAFIRQGSKQDTQGLGYQNAIIPQSTQIPQKQGIKEEIKQLIDTSAQKGREMQIIEQENFTPEVVEYIQKQNKKVAIEKLSQEEAEALGFKYPQDVRVTIDSNAINHTLKRHGAQSNLAQKSGQQAVEYSDIAKYREYVKNADETLKSADNSGSNVLVSYKQVNGYFVAVEQIKKKNNELGFKTLFKGMGNYKDSMSYKNTKAKAQTLSIGYEPSANSFALAKSLNSEVLLSHSQRPSTIPSLNLESQMINNTSDIIPQLEKAIKEAEQKQPYKAQIKPILESLQKEWREDENRIILHWKERVNGKLVKRTPNLRSEESIKNTLEVYKDYKEKDASREIQILQKALDAILLEKNKAKQSQEAIKAEIKDLEEKLQKQIAKSNNLDIFADVTHQRLKLYSNKYQSDSAYINKLKKDGYYTDNIVNDIKKVRESIQNTYNITPIKDFGTNYAEYYRDGSGAIKKILAEAEDFSKRKSLGKLSEEEKAQGTFKGQVAGAFYREDLEELSGSGEIDLVWGEITDKEAHKGFGLAHIMDKRKSEFIKEGLSAQEAEQKALEFVESLPKMIENAELETKNNVHTLIFKDNTKEFRIGLSKGWNGKGDNEWIITAYEKENAETSYHDTFTPKEPLGNLSDIIPQLEKAIKEEDLGTLSPKPKITDKSDNAVSNLEAIIPQKTNAKNIKLKRAVLNYAEDLLSQDTKHAFLGNPKEELKAYYEYFKEADYPVPNLREPKEYVKI
ncbi:hypothetical protein [Helicobacter turcicus]|uniref:Phage-Barnase-EndoU-ColicinE5/D-RelE like nuclease 3 domain-containing protein n=1 Tax=Helicobacter turcicus TaxID=2867412 RepID=A0ABS7JKS1_9HELI|nr:hypothetical protein [Helicobacter turcicus]MBX7489994.1 hypothetical protein [Helicobacter turcicus]MBX7544853.1 hypothetical protein [Helicobacter turcicus]